MSDNETEDAYGDGMDERPGAMLNAPLGEVPRREMLAVPPSAMVAEVIEMMNAQSVGCALVVDNDALVGIFTERDVLRKVASKTMDTASVLVSEVMTREPDSLPASSSIAFALNRMSIEGYRHIPVLDLDGKPVGVVAMRDIINWMVELYPNRVHTVPPAPRSHPTTREGA